MGKLSAEYKWRDPEHEKKSVIDEAQRYPWNWINTIGARPNRVIDQRAAFIFQGLNNGHYWDLFSAVDGYTSEPEEKRQERHDWATSTFEPQELNHLFDLAVRIAMVMPHGTDGAPGKQRPHSVLYERVVGRQDSLFHGKFDDEDVKRLNNGRFWEELPDMMPGLNHGHSYRVVNDVLENHSEDLDTSFAPKGLEIFRRNNGENPDWDFWLISKKGIDNFSAFMGQIDAQREELGITDDQLADLAAPYAVAAIGRVEEDYSGWMIPRFPKNAKGNYMRRLAEPWVARQLASSDVVRGALAKDLSVASSNYSNPAFAMDVLKLIPDPGDMFKRMIPEIGFSEDRIEFVRRWLNAKLPLGENGELLLLDSIR